MDDLFKHNMRYNGYYEELDKESVTDIVCDFIKEDVEREVSEMVGKLPQDILNRIRISKDDINIERLDVEGYIEGCLEPSEPEYDHHERDYDYGITGELDVLDCILNRHYNPFLLDFRLSYRKFYKFGNCQLPNWKRRNLECRIRRAVINLLARLCIYFGMQSVG